MKESLIFVNNFKKSINYFDKIIVNFPRSEYVLKDKIKVTCFEILELIYFSNCLNFKERINYQKRIISKIKMLDFYFKLSFDKKYISYKKYTKIGKHLEEIIKSIYGWIKYEKI